MGDNSEFGFARLVPGFDFLQNLAKGTSQSMPQMPHLSSWVAPTLNVEELDKRISELKAVLFWLDQNSTALGATIQALEVQKMTLATLKGMNVSMGEVADALKVKTAEAMGAWGKAGEAAREAVADRARKSAAKAKPAGKGEGTAVKAEGTAGNAEGTGGATAPVDPMQWWGALTKQFQQIAASAMQDVAEKTGAASARAATVAKAPAAAIEAAPAKAAKAAKKAAPPRKAAPRKRAAQS